MCIHPSCNFRVLAKYREEAYYLDRTVHYVNRVGLDTIKQRIVEDVEGRKALYERLLYSLQGLPDPWAEHVADEKLRRNFIPLKLVDEVVTTTVAA